jgi:type I restriction enzyme, S subunit
MSNKCKWVRLGDYIEKCDERNSERKYGVQELRGVNNSHEFCLSKAKTDGIDFAPYKIVHTHDFAYNPARLDIGSWALFEEKLCIVSTLYVVFHIKKEKELLPEFLAIYFYRNEFNRFISYNNWGSAREYFWYDDMENVQIPLPSISDQRKVINAWQSLREVKEQNDAIAAPLMQVCQSYMQELKYKYPAVEIGEFIEECNERNVEEKYTLDDVRGISIEKKMIETKANMDNVSLKPYKLFAPEEFCFVPITSRNGNKITLSMNYDDCTHIVSSSYVVFDINEKEKLLPNFLYLLFCRSEFDRYARFNSWGSAREAFSFEDMKRVRIPLPPLSVQQAIVNIYNCANEAKCIAEEADRMSREVCLALIQHVINN